MSRAARTTNELQREYSRSVTAGKRVTLLKIGHRSGAAKIAQATIAKVADGETVAWLWRRDSSFRRAASALGDWKAPDGIPPWRLGHGQSLAVFAPDDQGPDLVLAYWKRETAASVQRGKVQA